MESLTATPPVLLSQIAEPARLRILQALRGGEVAVGAIVARAGIAQSGVSRHLRLLHAAGIVRVRADGQRRLYALRPEPFEEAERWIAAFRSGWEARLDRFGVALEAAQQAREPADDRKDQDDG